MRAYFLASSITGFTECNSFVIPQVLMMNLFFDMNMLLSLKKSEKYQIKSKLYT